MIVVVWGGYHLLRPDSPDQIAEDQIELMQEAILTLENFNDSGDAKSSIDKLGELTARYNDLLKRRKKLGVEANQANENLTTEIKKLSGELLNESLQVEISDKDEAAEVTAAYEKFSSQ